MDNQIAASGFGFDGNGNPIGYNGALFTFDAENRLTGINTPGFAAAYDGDGLRASKAGGAGRSFFLYDGASPVLEMNGAGSVLAANGVGADGWRSRYYPVGSYSVSP